MDVPSRFAFYGSLRKGEPNFIHCLSGAAFTFEGVSEITGYKMYSLIDYPVAVKTGQRADRITVELFHIHSPDTCRNIHEMEVEAGYYTEALQVNGNLYCIYLFPQREVQRLDLPFVAGGDWLTFLGEKR